MKVLKAPDYKDWKQTCVCSRCKSELEYVISDIKAHHYDGSDCRDVGTPSSWSYSVKCVVCTMTIPVPKDKLDSFLEYKIQNAPDNGPYRGEGYFDR